MKSQIGNTGFIDIQLSRPHRGFVFVLKIIISSKWKMKGNSMIACEDPKRYGSIQPVSKYNLAAKISVYDNEDGFPMRIDKLKWFQSPPCGMGYPRRTIVA